MDLRSRLRPLVKPALKALGWISLGIVIGGWMFSDTQPRSVIALGPCEHRWRVSQITGLMTSVAIQKFPGWVPTVVLETDKVIAVRHPIPDNRNHFVVFPKRDIRELGDLHEGDEEYLLAMHAAIAQLVRDYHMDRYQVYSNGPGMQLINYLHFHVAGY